MQRGYSLIELVIVLAIFGVVAIIGAASYGNSRNAQAARQNAYVYSDALKEATLKAKAMESDTAWGVSVGQNSVTVFSGATFADRMVARDIDYAISDKALVSGITEVVFAKFTALPSTTGTTTFANAYATSSVYISPNGASW